MLRIILPLTLPAVLISCDVEEPTTNAWDNPSWDLEQVEGTNNAVQPERDLRGGGAVLTIGGVCPGPITVDISGLTPSGTFGIIRSSSAGSEVIPGGPCPGLVTGLGPGIALQTTGSADGAGNASFNPTVAAGACGFNLQVLDVDSCTLSNVDVIERAEGDLDCVCGGIYSEGDRVQALVDNPSGNSSIFAGDGGFVVAGSLGFPPLLVEWDGLTAGHDGNCEFADCGTCIDSPVNNRWYVECPEVGPE